MGTLFPVAIGLPIPFEEIAAIKDRQTLVNHLRARTYALGNLPDSAAEPRRARRRILGPIAAIKQGGESPGRKRKSPLAALLREGSEGPRYRVGLLRRRPKAGQPRPR